MLCLTLPVESEKSALELFSRYRRLTELVELRLDYNPGMMVAALVKQGAKVIATCRRVQDGGKYSGTEIQRMQILSQAYRDGASFVDIEIDATQNLLDVPDSARLCSLHNFSNEIIPWENLLARFPKNVGVIKIVQTANSANDNLELFHFLEKRPVPILVAHLMGRYGRLSRLLSHRFNCPFTYVVPDEYQSEIPGVLTTREVEMMRVAGINAETKIYGILGDPVEHSRSGEIYNAYFTRAKLNAIFLPVAVADVEYFLRDCEIISPVGFAVTMPHKERVLSICSELDESAQKAGAVNTLLKIPSGWKGFNTDYMAVKSFFAEENGAGEGAVIFGAGGAARSAAIALKELNFKVFICNRDVERAKKLVRDLSLADVVASNDWTKLNSKIIVNATAVGMTPQENESPLDVSLLTGQELVLDFVHTPEDTVLVRGARHAGCRVITGVRFFNRQADFQQRILLGGNN